MPRSATSPERSDRSASKSVIGVGRMPGPDSRMPTSSREVTTGVETGDSPLGIVLVVEDDELQAMGLSCLLEGAGFSVTCAADGAEAMRLSERSRPYLILTDYRLAGGISGIETIAMLRRRLDAVVPAIIVTGDTGAAIAEEAVKAAATLLYKPYSPDALLAAIRVHLQANASAPGGLQDKGGADQ